MKYDLSIHIDTIEAGNVIEAYAKALALLNDLAESNDGSELLANADPILEPDPIGEYE